VRRNPPRSLLTAVAPLIVAGTFTVAATAAAGIEPAPPTPLPDSAFAPVTVPSNVPGQPVVPDLDAGQAGAAQHVLNAELRAEARARARDEVLTGIAAGLPDRAQPRVRDAEPIVIDVTPEAAPDRAVAAATSHVLSGAASWYCRAGVSPCTYTHPDLGGFDAYAAAGPRLRAAIGPGWRGSIVWVDGIRVRLIDWCQCYQGERQEKLLDLYYDVYARTGGSVAIRW